MIITEKEIKRIVSIHFKEKYNINVKPEDMFWKYERIHGYDDEEMVSGLDVGGIDEEDN